MPEEDNLSIQKKKLKETASQFELMILLLVKEIYEKKYRMISCKFYDLKYSHC